MGEAYSQKLCRPPWLTVKQSLHASRQPVRLAGARRAVRGPLHARPGARTAARSAGGPPRDSWSDRATVVVLISAYLVLVFLVPVLLSLVVSYRSLPQGAVCGQCARAAVPLQRRWLRQLSRLPGVGLERRWCLHCGWEGVTRSRPLTQLRVTLAPRPEPGPRRDQASERVPVTPVPPDGTALDVRSLRVDGRTWRVQLQCWREQRSCYGRLVFIEPTGRSWADVVQSFSGATQFEVLGQALSMPDRLLATRLRQLLIAES